MSPWILTILLFSAPEGQLSLQAARAQALEHRPELVMLHARRAAAEAKLARAKAAERPRVAAKVEAYAMPGGELVEIKNADGTRLKVSGAPVLSEGASALEPSWSYGASVGMSWDIYDFGRTGAAKAAARAELYARRAEAAQTRSQLLAAVDAAYLAWVSAHQRATLSRQAAARVGAQLKALEQRIAAGALPASARIGAQADQASAELRAAYAEDAERKTRRSLGQAAGAELPAGTAPDLRILELGALAPELPDDPELAALSARQRAAEAEARRAARATNPVLSAQAQLGLRGQSANLFPLYRLGLGLSIPLWDGGESDAVAAAARAQAKAARAERERRLRERTEARASASDDLKQAARRVELAARLVKLNEARLSDAEARYREGAATAEELSRSRERHAQATGELLTAQLGRAQIALSPPR